MQTPATFVWNDQYLLGHGAMDDTHREFVTLVDRLLNSADPELPAALEAFEAHALAHFEQENAWMRANDFPARDCHIDEHDKVLESVRAVRQHLADGDCGIVRELAQALMDWFPGHADYMDSALATWLVKRSHGGAPLVLRRAAATREGGGE